MKQFINKYQKLLTGAGALTLLAVCYFQQRELSKLRKTDNIEFVGSGNKTIDSLQHLADSLHDENFSNSVTVGRYEIATEILKERNPKAAEQFEEILSHETE